MNQRISFDPIPHSATITPENAYLRVLNGPKTNQEIPLNPMTLMVGRNATPSVTSDLDLSPYELGDPPMTSRQHAVLEWVNGELRLCDLNSRNGTIIFYTIHARQAIRLTTTFRKFKVINLT